MFESFDCDLCGSKHSRVIMSANPYIGGWAPPAICQNCGFVFVQQRRSPEEIARAWDDLWQESYTSEWPAVKARLFYVAEWCDQTFKWEGKSCLDIGAGEGQFMKFVRDRGGFPIGIEPNKKNVQKIKHADMACHHGTLESTTPRQVDVVTILWTLENCGDCMDMLRRARACLGDGGRIVVATGSRILVPYKKPLGTYFSDNPADLHCFRWSANTLARALYEADFDLLTFNDYEQCDSLVVTARAINKSHETIPGPIGTSSRDNDLRQRLLPKDDPAEVEKFFEDWSRAWP